MMRAPRRLIHDEAFARALRNDLSHAAEGNPCAYDQAAGLERLRAAIQSGGLGHAAGGASAAQSSASSSSTSLVTKLGVLALVGTLGTWGAIKAVQSEDDAVEVSPSRAPVTAEAAIEIQPELATMDADEPRDAAVASFGYEQPARGGSASDGPDRAAPHPARRIERNVHDAPAAPPAPKTAPRSVATPSAAPRPASTVPPIDADAQLRLEIEQLAQARRLLRGDAAAALALVDRGQRRFTDGMFSEERAAIGIFALVRLHDIGRARQRAHAFLRHYPHGAFSKRIRAIESGDPEALTEETR